MYLSMLDKKYAVKDLIEFHQMFLDETKLGGSEIISFRQLRSKKWHLCFSIGCFYSGK
jgi:hypothetical protein